MVKKVKGLKVQKQLVDKFKFTKEGDSQIGSELVDVHSVTGTMGASGDVALTGELRLDRRISEALFGVPQIDGTTGTAELQDLIDNVANYEGFIVYLTNASSLTPFIESQKFYFCENGEWHPSPFVTVDTGETSTMPANSTGGTVSMSTGEQVVMASNTTVLDSNGAAYTGDIEVNVRASDNEGVPGYSILSQGGSVSSVVSFSPPGTTFNPPLDVTIPLNTTPSNPSDLSIIYHDGTSWSEAFSVSAGTLTYDANTNSVSFQVSSFSSYAVVDATQMDSSIARLDSDGDGVGDNTDPFPNDPYLRFTAHRQHRFYFWGLPTTGDVATKELTSADGWLQNSKYSKMRTDSDPNLTGYPVGDGTYAYTQTYTGEAHNGNINYTFTEWDTQPDGNVYTMNLDLPAEDSIGDLPAGYGINMLIGNADISSDPAGIWQFANGAREWHNPDGYVYFRPYPPMVDELDSNGDPTGLKTWPLGGRLKIQLKHDTDNKIYVRIAHGADEASIDIDSVAWVDADVIDADHDRRPTGYDLFPNDPNNTYDRDQDGLGTGAEAAQGTSDTNPDTDGDGVDDATDAFPTDASETTDTDGDGVGDNSDAFPNDPAESADNDLDGVGANAEAAQGTSDNDTDSDDDGVDDATDAFPADASETTDTDGDGVGDNADAYPNDPTESADFDGDGIGDNADPDADNDLLSDTDEAIVGTSATFVDDQIHGFMSDSRVGSNYNDVHDYLDVTAMLAATGTTDFNLSLDFSNVENTGYNPYPADAKAYYNYRSVYSYGSVESINDDQDGFEQVILHAGFGATYATDNYALIGPTSGPSTWVANPDWSSGVSSSFGVTYDYTDPAMPLPTSHVSYNRIRSYIVENLTLSHADYSGSAMPIYISSMIYLPHHANGKYPDLYVNFGQGNVLLPHSHTEATTTVSYLWKTFKFERDPSTGEISAWYANDHLSDVNHDTDWVPFSLT
jgi:hypothetical protein